MKQSYLLLLLMGLLGQRAWGQATTWRPFRQGFVYGFAPVSSSGTTTLHTLRVDSAYATAGGDSVYLFNRLLRLVGSSTYEYRKSRNNLLGARLRWQPGTRDYYLEANAEPTIDGATTPTALLLRPRAAAGSTWVASTQPALSATLSSRSYGQVGTLPDSLATITLSNGQQFIISQHYGLVRGPQWLGLTGSSASWQQVAAPRAGLGSYAPQALFALSTGDELGYEIVNYAFASQFICSQSYLLRRITSRQLTTDSLVLTYRQQTQTTNSSFPGCGPAGTTTGPVMSGRWAISLRTGRSPQFPFLALLTGEYASPSSTTLYRGRSVAVQPTSSQCLGSTETLSFVPMYPYQPSSGSYYGGLDDAAVVYEFSASLGLGPTTAGSTPNHTNRLIYYSRNGVSCGSRANFAALLPTRAALAAQAATLYPNPATSQVTLALAAPAPAGATLTLTDALGRQCWSQPVALGQSVLPLPVASRPAGLYLVQLTLPGAAPLTWKLLLE